MSTIRWDRNPAGELLCRNNGEDDPPPLNPPLPRLLIIRSPTCISSTTYDRSSPISSSTDLFLFRSATLQLDSDVKHGDSPACVKNLVLPRKLKSLLTSEPLMFVLVLLLLFLELPLSMSATKLEKNEPGADSYRVSAIGDIDIVEVTSPAFFAWTVKMKRIRREKVGRRRRIVRS